MAILVTWFQSDFSPPLEVWIQANEEARLQRLAQRGSGVDAQLGRKMKLDFEAPGLSPAGSFFGFCWGGFFVQNVGDPPAKCGGLSRYS